MPYLRPCLTVVLLLVGAFLHPSAPTLAQTELDDRMYDIARELWCPLCSGVRLDACELQACVQMRAEIRQLLAEGRDPEWIVAYFEEAERQGVLQHQVTQGTGDVLTLSIGRCTYARLLATLGCPELGDLVREMERAAISELAQACNLSLTWTAGASPGTGIFCLQQRSTRAAE